MTTQNLYQKTLNEEMSHSQFLWHIRRDPQYTDIITNTMSYEDTVTCLKSKGYIWETQKQESNIKSVDFLGSFKQLMEGANKKQKLKGGKGDKITPDQVNYYEFRKGWKHELEHTDDIDKAKEIALDHLSEDPMYYTRLEIIEFEAKKKERADLPIDISKKKASVKDEKNQMTPAKKQKKETSNVSDSGKKEKATSKNAGIKKMKGGTSQPTNISEAKSQKSKNSTADDLFSGIDMSGFFTSTEEPDIVSAPEKKTVGGSSKKSVSDFTKGELEEPKSNEKESGARIVKIGDKEVYLTDRPKDIKKGDTETGQFEVLTIKGNQKKYINIDAASYKNILKITTNNEDEIKKGRGKYVYRSISPVDEKAKNIAAEYSKQREDIEKKITNNTIKRAEDSVKKKKITIKSPTKNDIDSSGVPYEVQVYVDGRPQKGPTVLMTDSVIENLTGTPKESIKSGDTYKIKITEKDRESYGEYPVPNKELKIIKRIKATVSIDTKTDASKKTVDEPKKDSAFSRPSAPSEKKSDIINYYYAVNPNTKKVFKFYDADLARGYVKRNPDFVFMGKNQAIAQKYIDREDVEKKKKSKKQSTSQGPTAYTTKDFVVIDKKTAEIVQDFDTKEKANLFAKEQNSADYEVVSKSVADTVIKKIKSQLGTTEEPIKRRKRFIVKEEQKEDPKLSAGLQVSFSIQDPENLSSIQQVRDTVKNASFNGGQKRLTMSLSGGAEVVFTADASGEPVGIYFSKSDTEEDVKKSQKITDIKDPLNKILDKYYPKPKDVEENTSNDSILEDYIRKRIKEALKEGDEGQFIGMVGPNVIKKKLTDYMQKYNPDWETDPSPLQRSIGAEYQGIIAKLVAELNDREPGLGTSIYKEYTGKTLRGDQAYQATPPPSTLAYDPAKLVSRGGRIAEEFDAKKEAELLKNIQRYNDVNSSEFKQALKDLQAYVTSLGSTNIGKDAKKAIMHASDLNK